MIRAESVPEGRVHISGPLGGPFLGSAFENLGTGEADEAASGLPVGVDGSYRRFNSPAPRQRQRPDPPDLMAGFQLSIKGRF